MRRVCVFCGSSPGGRAEYAAAARELGYALAERGLGLVYGGGNVGLMGVIARAVLERKGEVIGVIPSWLVEREVALTDLADLRVVATMHERKALMAELADAFAALPGGLGTVEEFVEVLTWAQLKLHAKPCGLLNVGSYFDGLLSFLDHAVAERFVDPGHRSRLLVAEQPEALLDQLTSYKPTDVDKAEWARRLSKG